jgi:hypothetical protein
MLYMVVEKYRNGVPAPVYRRRQAQAAVAPRL